MLAKNARLHVTNYDHETPLTIACFNVVSSELVRILLNHYYYFFCFYGINHNNELNSTYRQLLWKVKTEENTDHIIEMNMMMTYFEAYFEKCDKQTQSFRYKIPTTPIAEGQGGNTSRSVSRRRKNTLKKRKKILSKKTFRQRP